jgi:hypothetical protein
VVQRTVELVPLVGQLGQAHIRRARGRRRRLAGPGGGFQRLLAGPDDLVEPAVEPSGYGQLHLRDGPQYPFVVPALGHGLRTELSRTPGVTAELGEVTTHERDRRGDVHQQAAGRADRGLEWLVAGIGALIGVGTLGRVD